MAVTYEDVAISLGRSITLGSAEEKQITQWIADARLLIQQRLGDLALLDQAVLDYVVREAVVARASNPEGYTSEAIDDYTYRYGAETRRVTILDEWWAMLDPDAGGGAFSVRPSFEPDTLSLDSWA